MDKGQAGARSRPCLLSQWLFGGLLYRKADYVPRYLSWHSLKNQDSKSHLRVQDPSAWAVFCFVLSKLAPGSSSRPILPFLLGNSLVPNQCIPSGPPRMSIYLGSPAVGSSAYSFSLLYPQGVGRVFSLCTLMPRAG